MKNKNYLFWAILVFAINIAIISIAATYAPRDWQVNMNAKVGQTECIATDMHYSGDRLYRTIDYQTGKVIYILYESQEGLKGMAVGDLKQ